MSVSAEPKFWSGLKAGADFTNYQYYLAEAGATAGQVTVCNATGDVPLGVIYDKPAAAARGVNLAAFVPGTKLKIKVGGAGVTAGWVGTDSSGLLVTKTANNDIIFGRSLQTWASGDIAEIYVTGLAYLGA